MGAGRFAAFAAAGLIDLIIFIAIICTPLSARHYLCLKLSQSSIVRSL